MPRPATGSVRFESGRWKARVTVNGRRRLVDIEPPLTRDPEDRPAAIVEARKLSKLARDPSLFVQSRPASAGELARDWFDRWLAAKKERGQKTNAPRSHFDNHIGPVIGGTPMSRVTSEQLERIVQELDAKVARGALMWKSAINIWGTVTKAFDDACRGKVLELRCRAKEDNPARAVRGPDRGVETEQVHLYPSEFLQLVACTGVPLFRRRCYALAIYAYLRPGELEAIAWDDIDLARETMQVRRSVDRETDAATSPKAGRARATFAIEPELLPLLRAMHKESGGVGAVVGRLGDERELARTLRADLATAGVTRHELHHKSKEPPRDWMRMHGLRHTGITWMAVRGDEPLVIMARAGHEDMQTTLGYVSRAALVRRGYGSPFPPLPASLTKIQAETSDRFAETIGRGSGRGGAKQRKNKAAVAETHGNRTNCGTAEYGVRRTISLVKAGQARPPTAPNADDMGGSADSSAAMSRAAKELLGRFARAFERAIWEDRIDAASRLLDAMRERVRSASPADPAAPTATARAQPRSPHR